MSLLVKEQAQVTASSASARILNVGSTLLVLILSLVLFSTPLRQGPRMLAYAQDDLYYYLVIARNLAAGHGSTFDGATLTNGYHPLYMLLLLGVARLDSSLRAAFTALWFLDVTSAVAIFVSVRRLLARRLDNAFIVNGFALGIVTLCAFRIVQQMEVTLTLPIGLFFLLLLDREPRALTPARWSGIGLVGSLLILSRLDAAILVLLCLAALLCQSAFRRELGPAKIACFAAAFFPLLLLYVGINFHYFHLLTPISGAAKQARSGLGLFRPAIHDSLSRGAKLMFVLSLLGLCGMAGLSAPSALRSRITLPLSPQLRALCIACLLFPFVHFGANLLMSDWMIFPWYRYSLIFSLTAVLILVCQALCENLAPGLQTLFGLAVLLVSAVSLLSVRYVPDQMMSDIADAAFVLRDFARTHPGRYAMGDRAGMVGYIDEVPTIQLEGLVMDKAFLDRIRHRDPLRQVLQDYRIDYYVGFDWRRPGNWPAPGCFHAREPNHAGPFSPIMTGDFCQTPVLDYMRPTGRTLVFDLRTSNPGGSPGQLDTGK